MSGFRFQVCKRGKKDGLKTRSLPGDCSPHLDHETSALPNRRASLCDDVQEQCASGSHWCAPFLVRGSFWNREREGEGEGKMDSEAEQTKADRGREAKEEERHRETVYSH